MLFHQLELENYRGFQRYRLDGLARVNLLVGKNNCGKTSILEAVQILGSQGDPEVIAGIASRRGEVASLGKTQRHSYPDIAHFFYGHDVDLDQFLAIRGEESLGRITLRVVDFSEADLGKEPQSFAPLGILQRNLIARGVVSARQSLCVLKIETEDSNTRSQHLLVPRDGAILIETGPIDSRDGWDQGLGSSIRFITPESLHPHEMTIMWDNVITEGRETEIIEAIQILEPEIANLFFLSGEGASRPGRGGILVSFTDPKRKRVPLGSFGEGMRRLLALALSLSQARGGILLIDEIDTGLHYSILGDMWLLLVNAAKQFDIQVFATTHSLDCIRGLAWLCEHHPELAGDVSVQKIDTSLDESVALDSRKLKIAIEQDLEVR